MKEFLYNGAIVDFETRNVPVNVPVNSTESTLLALMKHNPSITYDEMALEIGKTRKTVSRAIASLKQQGRIARKGSDKTGTWVTF